MTAVYQSSPEFAESLEIAKQLLNSVKSRIDELRADPNHPMYGTDDRPDLVFCDAATLAFEVYCEMFPAPEGVMDLSPMMAFCDFMGTWVAHMDAGSAQIACGMLCEVIQAATTKSSVIHQPVGNC